MAENKEEQKIEENKEDVNIMMIMLMTCSRDISHSFMNLQ